MGEALYPLLGRDWTVKSSGGKHILHNFRHGIGEDRYDLSSRVYQALRLCTGANSTADITPAVDVDPQPYFDWLAQEEPGSLTYLREPAAVRTFLAGRLAGNFLGRVLWHITGKCNCDCRHCYMATRDWEDISSDELGSVIQQLADMNVSAVSLTGGEPLVHPRLFEILQGLDEAEIKIEGIFTNATLLLPETLARIEAVQAIPFFVSLNGPRDVPHDSFMGRDGGYAVTIDNLRQAIRSGVSIFANTILSAMAGADQDIVDFYRLMIDLGIRRWRVSVPFLEGNWRQHHEALSLSLEQELQAYRRILELWLADGRPLELELGHVFRYINGRRVCRDYAVHDYACDYFRERMVIMPNGEVVPCSLLINPPFVFGDLKTQSLEEIWESPPMRRCKDLRVEQVMQPECSSCPALSRCAAGCRANAVLEGRGYDGLDNYTCHLYRADLHRAIETVLDRAGLGWQEEPGEQIG